MQRENQQDVGFFFQVAQMLLLGNEAFCYQAHGIQVIAGRGVPDLLEDAAFSVISS